MPATSRLAKADRREQLLDIAAEVLLAQGRPALTMERLAQQAGVSKALPYLHFDNAEGVLVALYRREVAHLGQATLAAVRAAEGPEGKARAAVRAYFDVVSERGAIFSVLQAPASSIPHRADGGTRSGLRWVEELLVREVGLPRQRGPVAAAIVTAALAAAVDAWAHREVRRPDAEDAVTGVILHLAGLA